MHNYSIYSRITNDNQFSDIIIRELYSNTLFYGCIRTTNYTFDKNNEWVAAICDSRETTETTYNCEHLWNTIAHSKDIIIRKLPTINGIEYRYKQRQIWYRDFGNIITGGRTIKQIHAIPTILNTKHTNTIQHMFEPIECCVVL